MFSIAHMFLVMIFDLLDIFGDFTKMQGTINEYFMKLLQDISLVILNAETAFPENRMISRTSFRLRLLLQLRQYLYTALFCR